MAKHRHPSHRSADTHGCVHRVGSAQRKRRRHNGARRETRRANAGERHGPIETGGAGERQIVSRGLASDYRGGGLRTLRGRDAEVSPAPERATVCGLPLALSVIVTIADRAPAAVGVKVTMIVQFAPAATLVPQAFV